MKIYFLRLFHLLGSDYKKIPIFLILFLILSMIDMLSIGMVAPYIALVVSPDDFSEGILYEIVSILELPKKTDSLLIILGIFLSGIFLLKSIAGIFIQRSIIKFSYKQQFRLQSILMNGYQEMNYFNYLERNSSEYIHAMRMYTAEFASVLQMLLKLISEFLVGLALFTILAWANIQVLALLVIFLGGGVIIFDKVFKKKIKLFSQKAHEYNIKMVQGLHESMEGLKEIRILSVEKNFYDTVIVTQRNSMFYSIKAQTIQIIPRFILEFIIVTLIVFVVIVIVYYNKNYSTFIPTIGLFSLVAIRLIPSFSLITNGLMVIRAGQFPISELYKELTNFNKNKNFQLYNRTVKSVFRKLEVKDIKFSYPNSKNPVLNKISLEINAGEFIGLVGISGSGKTTLVDLILGLFEPQYGEVLYNGKPLNNSYPEWRSHTAYLPQQVFLMDNTLRNNVALGLEDSEIDNNRLRKALKLAKLEELVEELPQKVETMIGERGIRLSGGQRQRVALARAFYHQRDVLVMDESTSALDSDTENQIIKELQSYRKNKTLIIIAHRISTLKYCDKIYRLEKGTLVDQGVYKNFVKAY